MMTISTQKETDVIEKKSPEEIRIERLQKKYGRNTEEISKLNINGDTNILME